MSEPRRREVRRTHLDASVMPAERALLARAQHLDELEKDHADQPGAFSPADLAAQFRSLAEELHWW